MIETVQYSSRHQPEWDAFVKRSKNGSFIFQRAYQDYHSDRFTDHSYLFFLNNELIALLPACLVGDDLVSHGGLTFGGILSDEKMTTPTMLSLVESLILSLRKDHIKRLIYKTSPTFNHTLPADEDLYALTRSNAKLIRRDISSILQPHSHPQMQTRRLRAAKKARNSGIVVRESDDLPSFWRILEETLRGRHNTTPVHSLEEIQKLHTLFPSNIRLFGSYANDQLLAGTLIYENPNVAHAQYIAASPQGRNSGALDLVFIELITQVFMEKPWFSFGISTEQNGNFLNKGLIEQKEGFGARACVYDSYELIL